MADTNGSTLADAALASAERLAAAEREVELARADYHRAIRRMHLAGAPVREMAPVLGLSHQRIQQIVQAGGGSWWSRTWRARREATVMSCSFCDRPAAEVAKLVAGPGVYICDSCVSAAEGVLSGGGSRGGRDGRLVAVPRESRVRCSFCGKRAGPGVSLAGDGRRRICGTCTGMCRDIIDMS